MKQTTNYKLRFLWSILIAFTIYITSCSDSDNSIPEPTPTPPTPVSLKIEADKSIIKANGNDTVKFIVKADDIEVSTSVKIFLQNDSTVLSKMDFSTKEAGAYTFYATYDGVKSNEINIEATDIPILLSVDKETIKANNKDIATFTVTADGEDVSANAVITMIESPDFIISEASFFTQNAGSYTFYATYDDNKSNEISIDASEVVLLLSADKSSIKADNSDKVSFTVTIDGENVTADSELYLWDDTKLDALSFLTDEAGSYTFYAVYDGEKTNEISINATYVNLVFQMQHCVIQIASTICPNCPKLTNEIEKYTGNKSIYNVVALHPYGRICNSALAGALASTAIQFAEIAGISSPPAGVIDLHHPFYLYPTTTQSRMKDQFNLSTMARERIAETGIAIQSNVNNGNIDFTVKVKSVNTNEYRFFAFVVEDKIIHSQRSYDENNNSILIKDYEHNNVGTYMLEGEDPLTGVNLGEIQSGKEITRTYSINTSNFNTKREVNLDNCRIVAYTLREIGGKYYIDNATNCPVNGTVQYLYKK
ncbi:MAG: Omp28-related outer membrane protein [Tannerella sp.]|jgi:hypothetical protein|nr:Omp28-related outer membrane protein [Tannerella sp.]